MKYCDLDLVVYLSEEYRKFFEILYYPTIPTDIENIIVYFKDYKKKDLGLAGNTKDTFYRQIMKDRMYFYYNHIKNNMGKNILFTDVDLVFFRKFKGALLSFLEKNDMMFQNGGVSNRGHVNGGFWVVKANDAVVDFFENHFLPVINKEDVEKYSPGYPQTELQALLDSGKSSVRWGTLPDVFGHASNRPYFYHAVAVSECLENREGAPLTSLEGKFFYCYRELAKYEGLSEIRATIEDCTKMDSTMLSIKTRKPNEKQSL